MAKRKKIDNKKLIEMVELEFSQKDIMEKYDFKTSSQFKNYYLKALIDEGKAPPISTKRGPTKGASKEIVVNKRGSLIIPRAMIDSMEFSEGDKFAARKTKAGISLRKAD